MNLTELKKLPLQTKLFINGEFINSKDNKTFPVVSPINEQIITYVQQAGTYEVDLAVNAARQAFDNGQWSESIPDVRSKVLFKLADLIQKNASRLAQVQTWNNGKPFIFAQNVDVVYTAKTFRYYAGWCDKIRGQVIPANGPTLIYTTKQPVGVVAQVIPWNFPLLMLGWKLAPALAAGCTVVLKTAEQTPLTGLILAQLIQQAGFPPGVVNIISGYGATGAYLVQHSKVDKVAFTGSTQVGYLIMKNSHKTNLKRVTLQLGGKSPHIITQFADLQKAIYASCRGLFYNSGQCCNAGSRLYVHAKIYDKFVKLLQQSVKTMTVGDPFEATTTQGPVISKQQFEKILGYIESGISEGAKLLTGGKRLGNKGYFIQPTVFIDAKDNMKIVKQQIFGPVMVVSKYQTTEQAIKRANDSRYGLASGVITENFEQANYFARKIRAGTVYVNTYHIMDVHTPFGGYKDSGMGRELGEQGLNNYLESKTISINRGQGKL